MMKYSPLLLPLRRVPFFAASSPSPFSFLALLAAVVLAAPVHGQERKALVDIDTDALTEDTQFSVEGGGDQMSLIWPIPVEFWKALFEQDASMTAIQRAQVVAALEGVVVLGIVQADITDDGAFQYYPEQEVRKHLQIRFVDDKGQARPIPLAQTVSDDVRTLLGAMKPVLTAAMGAMGQNFHFLVIDDDDGSGSGARAWDPYAFGKLEVKLKRRDGSDLAGALDGPVNSLFVPRKCPNGKDAHVTWKFCPWTGQELK